MFGLEEAAVNLIQAWKESLRLFERENLKSFLMITIKTVLDFYRVINRPLTAWGNWTLLAVIVLLVFATNIIKVWNLFWIGAIFLNSMHHFFLFIFTLAMRPSMGIKDAVYYRSYIEQFWLLLIVTILLGVSRLYVIPFVFLWYIFSLLFAFDTTGTGPDLLLSFQNGFRMLLYNLPVCAALVVVLALINVLLDNLVALALGSIAGLTLVAILYVVFIPIEVALITNLYIKCLHSQSSLYFPQPK